MRSNANRSLTQSLEQARWADMDVTSVEAWRPVVGWEGLYEVSDLGRVRTIPRKVPIGRGWRIVPGRVRRPSVQRTGYHLMVLSSPEKQVGKLVHIMVLEAFVGPRPEGMQGCHFDGVKSNNALSNLRWDTVANNRLDAVRIGSVPDPNRIHCTRGHELTEENTFYSTGRPNTRQCRRCRYDWQVEYRAHGVRRRS